MTSPTSCLSDRSSSFDTQNSVQDPRVAAFHQAVIDVAAHATKNHENLVNPFSGSYQPGFDPSRFQQAVNAALNTQNPMTLPYNERTILATHPVVPGKANPVLQTLRHFINWTKP